MSILAGIVNAWHVTAGRTVRGALHTTEYTSTSHLKTPPAPRFTTPPPRSLYQHHTIQPVWSAPLVLQQSYPWLSRAMFEVQAAPSQLRYPQSIRNIHVCSQRHMSGSVDWVGITGRSSSSHEWGLKSSSYTCRPADNEGTFSINPH